MADASLAPARVVFIGGSGRSGSTLIERLLGELPSVCNVGEVVHLWERGLQRGETCGCGTPLPDCPFWIRVGDVAFGGWDQFDVAQFLQTKKSVDRNRHIFRLAASTPGRPTAAAAPAPAGPGLTGSFPAARAAGSLPARAAWYADAMPACMQPSRRSAEPR